MPTIQEEHELAERLKAHGIDIYAGGEYPSLRDRLAHAIVRERFGTVIAGRHDHRPETYGGWFERLYSCRAEQIARGAALARKVAR